MKSKLLTIAVPAFYETILNKLAENQSGNKAKAIRRALALEFKALWPDEYSRLCEKEKNRFLDKIDFQSHIDNIAASTANTDD